MQYVLTSYTYEGKSTTFKLDAVGQWFIWDYPKWVVRDTMGGTWEDVLRDLLSYDHIEKVVVDINK